MNMVYNCFVLLYLSKIQTPNVNKKELCFGTLKNVFIGLKKGFVLNVQTFNAKNLNCIKHKPKEK